MKKISIYFFFLFGSLTTLGQTALIAGKIIDTNKQIITSGDAFLLSKIDSTIIKYTPIVEGNFSFDPVKKGEYFLKISCLGYKEKIETISFTETIFLTIILSESATSLQGVTVKSSRKIFTNGNTKINIENSVFSAIANPVELLAKLPAIQVSQSGETINVIGKGEPLIYIENQRITITDLNALAVNDIKTIEIINNPSSKYEAQGRTVILITRKSNKREGLKVDLSETAMIRKYFTNRTGVELSLKNKKVEIKANLQYNQIKNWESNAYDFGIINQNIQSNYSLVSITTRPQFIFGTEIFYQINDDSYFSVNTSLRQQNESFPIFTNSYLKEGAIENRVTTSNLNKYDRVYSTSTVSYNKKFKRLNGQLFLGCQYSAYKKELKSNISNNYNNTIDTLSQNRFQKNKISVFTARVDFEKNFKNNIKLEIGVNISTPRSNPILNIANYNPVSYTFSNYNYKEETYAAYLQLSGQLKKINYSVGVRLESNQVQGKFMDSTSFLVDKKNTQLFPKLSINIPIDSSKSISFNYGRTISRPDFSTVSQLVVYINPYFEWASNINILPTITDEIAANFQYKDYSIGLNYSRQDGPVFADFIYNTATSILRRMDRNYKLRTELNINLTVPLKYKLWSSTNSLTSGIIKVEDPSAIIRNPTPYLYAYSNHQFKLPKDFTLSFTAWGLTKRNVGAFERNALFSFDTSLSKSFYKTLNCTLSFNNIFKTLADKESFTINNIASNGVYYDTRDVSLLIKYSFGKIKNSTFKNKAVDENTNRIN